MDSISNVSNSKIKWSALTPASTTVNVYTGINSSATTPPSSWDLATSSSAISNASGDLTGKYLWTKIVLSSNIATSTPEINWLAYGINDSGASSITTLQDLYYTYDNVGNITNIIDLSDTKTNKVIDFGYDYLNRLTRASTTSAVTAGFNQTYTYDPIGNIMNKSDIGNYVYGNTNYANPHAATQINGINYSYDNNGNLTNDSTWQHSWTYDNRLASSTNGLINVTYSYDHTGQRVKMTNGTDSYIYPNKYFYINNATTTKQIFANDRLIATIEGNGNATSTYYTHSDHLGGSSVITDNTGTLTQTLDYYPFGGIRINEKEGSFDEKRKFTGHEYDDATGLNYMNARYQNPTVGRFVSQDKIVQEIGGNKFSDRLLKNKYILKYPRIIPDFLDTESENSNPILSDYLSQPQGLNSYSYVSNNPLIYTDPTGESESAEVLVNGLSGRGWKSDVKLTDISKIPCTISSPQTASQKKTYISVPGNSPSGTISAARPAPPSYDQRRSISDKINKVSEKVDALGQAVDTPGFGAALTSSASGAVLMSGHPEASIAVLAGYPIIDFSVKALSVATSFVSDFLGRASSWFIN